MTKEGLAHDCSTGQLCRSGGGNFIRRRWWRYTIASTPCWDSSGFLASFYLIATDPPECIGFNDSDIAATWAKYVRGDCSNSEPESGTIYYLTALPATISIETFGEECNEGINNLRLVWSAEYTPMRLCWSYGIPYIVCGGGLCTAPGGTAEGSGLFCDGGCAVPESGNCLFEGDEEAVYWSPGSYWSYNSGWQLVNCDGEISFTFRIGMTVPGFGYKSCLSSGNVGSTLGIDKYGYPFGESIIPLYWGALYAGEATLTVSRV